MTDLTVKIDPAEALLAVIGVRPIISREVEHVWKRDLREADGLAKKLTTLARDVCRGELVDVPFGEFKYSAALRDLSAPYKPEQVEKMIRDVPRALQAAFMQKAREVFESLRQKLPKAAVVTIAGVNNVLPDDMAIHKFIIELDAVDDPLRVFPWMASGSLTKRQIGAVREFYPSLSAAIDEALIGAITDEKAAVKSWELSPRAEMGVGKWLGRSRISPQLQKAMQSNFQQANKEQPAPSPTNKPNAVAKEALSPAQTAAFAGQTK